MSETCIAAYSLRVTVWKVREDEETTYEVRIDSLSDGDPVYGYKSKRGAMIAAAKYAKKYPPRSV